jgi:hypothetical protein
MTKKFISDAERFKLEYNDARRVCLCKTGKTCEILKRLCKPDDWRTCPLFVFVKKVPGKYTI